MAVARARYIPSLLQAHLDDLAFIAGQRREALHSRLYSLREFGELNERLEAHLQGALITPYDALAAQLQPQLAAEDRDEAFAAACVLLRLAQAKTTQAVVVEFSRARGATLAGLRDALGLAPPALFTDEIRSALEKAKPTTAVAAAVVLANQRLLDAASPRLAKLLEHDDPAVCELAWRAALLVDSAAPTAAIIGAPLRPFEIGLAHASPAVRHTAWCAVAWAGQAAALPMLRKNAASSDTPALHWLAVLGNTDDAPVLQKATLALDDVRARCCLLARFGHPSALNALVRWMAMDDVVLAVAAREAFTRITGIDIRGERRTLPVADDADDFTREMAPDLWMPDVKKARAAMERHGAVWAAGTRWCNGHRVDGEVTREQLALFDLEARWDIGARAAMAGKPVTAPPPIY